MANRIRIGREIINNVGAALPPVAQAQGSSQYRYFIDERGNANGRGAYVCKTCIPQAVKKRQLNRSFKGNVPQEIYDTLTKL